MLDQIIWQNLLDHKYRCRVIRLTERTGTLSISDDDKELISCVVPLAYGALFGPDVDDVNDWQERCVKWIDTRSKL